MSGFKHHHEIPYHHLSPSNFYGIPKIHTPGCPLRPIISNVGAVSRPLAQQLSPYLGKFSEAHLSSTQLFKEKLVAFSSSNSTSQGRMASLDVTSLFTNVQSEDILNFIERKITANKIKLPIPRDIFMSLLRLCIEGNRIRPGPWPRTLPRSSPTTFRQTRPRPRCI